MRIATTFPPGGGVFSPLSPCSFGEKHPVSCRYGDKHNPNKRKNHVSTTVTAGHIAVSGRELHEFLGVETRYNDWFNRMVEYGFVENQDFEVLLKNEQNPQGGRPSADHAISIDMAKEISMIQRTEKGKEARRYFIECERRLRDEKLPPPLPPPQVLSIDNVPIDVPAGVSLSSTERFIPNGMFSGKSFTKSLPLWGKHSLRYTT